MCGLSSRGFNLAGSFASVSAAGVNQLPDGKHFHMTSDKLQDWGWGTFASGRLTGSLDAWDTRLSSAFSSTTPSILAIMSDASCCHACIKAAQEIR